MRMSPCVYMNQPVAYFIEPEQTLSPAATSGLHIHRLYPLIPDSPMCCVAQCVYMNLPVTYVYDPENPATCRGGCQLYTLAAPLNLRLSHVLGVYQGSDPASRNCLARLRCVVCGGLVTVNNAAGLVRTPGKTAPPAQCIQHHHKCIPRGQRSLQGGQVPGGHGCVRLRLAWRLGPGRSH